MNYTNIKKLYQKYSYIIIIFLTLLVLGQQCRCCSIRNRVLFEQAEMNNQKDSLQNIIDGQRDSIYEYEKQNSILESQKERLIESNKSLEEIVRRPIILKKDQ